MQTAHDVIRSCAFVPLRLCALPPNQRCKAGPSTLWAARRVAFEERYIRVPSFCYAFLPLVFLVFIGCSSSFLHCSSSFLHCSSSSVHCSSSFLHCSQRSSAPRFALTADSSPPRAPLMVKSIKRATFLQDRALQEARGLDDRSDANCQCTHMCPPRAAKLPVPRPAGWFVLAFACWTPHRSHAAG